jgi:hypothetical protein
MGGNALVDSTLSCMLLYRRLRVCSDAIWALPRRGVDGIPEEGTHKRAAQAALCAPTRHTSLEPRSPARSIGNTAALALSQHLTCGSNRTLAPGACCVDLDFASTLTYSLKRGSVACNLQGTLEFVPTGVPTLDEFKKKLDNEHDSISGRLQEGARARHELQTLKGRLVEELDEGRHSLDVELEKVDAKLGAVNKMRHNEQEHGMYLELRLEEIKGHLDGNALNKAKLEELIKKLDFELQVRPHTALLEAHSRMRHRQALSRAPSSAGAVGRRSSASSWQSSSRTRQCTRPRSASTPSSTTPRSPPPTPPTHPSNGHARARTHAHTD